MPKTQVDFMDLPITVDVEMTLAATVTLTQEIVDGIKDQYLDAWEQHKDDPEELAKMMLYASLNPRISSSNRHSSDIWDGVGEMQGLIVDVELY